MDLFIVSGGAVVAVLLLAMGVYVLVREREGQSAFAAKVKAQSATVVDSGAGPPVSKYSKDLLMHFLHSIGNATKPKEKAEINLFQQRFLQAGYRGKNTVAIFFGAKALCGLCLATAFVVLRIVVNRPMPVITTMLLVVVLAALGFYLPNLWLSIRRSQRQERFLLGFPDALDLLVVCAEAGMGLDAAIKRVGDEMRLSRKVIADEFTLLNLELRAGRERKDALKNLAARVGLDEVKSWVTLLIQTDKFGTSVAQALRVHSDSMRVKRTLRVEEIAAKLPVKLLFPTILFIFPSLFVVLMGPALIQVWRLWSR